MSFGKKFLVAIALIVAVIVGMMLVVWVLKASDRQLERQFRSIEESIRSGENQADIQKLAIQQEAYFRNSIFIDVIFINEETEKEYDLTIGEIKNPRDEIIDFNQLNQAVVITKSSNKSIDIKEFLEGEDIHLKAGDILKLLLAEDFLYIFVTKFDNGDFHVEKARMEI